MKSATYHRNGLGTVVNETAATGFRLEDDHGNWVEAHVTDAGTLIVYTSPVVDPKQQELPL